MQISKSDYMLFLRHPAWLWLKKHDKDKLPPFDADTQAMFDAGHAFEPYAEQLFPGGVRLGFDNYDEYKSLTERTTKALQDGAKTIFQGRFEYGKLTFVCDVIQVVKGKIVDLIEIKSSSRAKVDHEFDLAFQMIVLEGCGYKVRNISVVHVNSEYVRNGAVRAEELTKVTDVTEKVNKRLNATREHIKNAINTIEQAKIPDMSPSLCGLASTAEWIKIYKLLKGINKGDGSIYDIYSPSATLIGKLEQAKITKLADIPEDFDGLSDKQRWQIKALRQNKVIIDHKKIKQFLDQVEYPIYFLDYETLSALVPYFEGQRPYQQVPFQYSLHIIDEPDAKLRHFEYLHSANSDPVRPLSESLAENIGPKGSIFVWYQDFEKGRNTEMGDMLPEFHKFYHRLNERIIDLIVPFFDFYYVDARFGGSASIKDVLPVMVPELSYKELGIQEGGAAQRLWMEAILGGKHAGKEEQILSDLLEYCKLDTLAMVEIYEKLLAL